MKKNFYFRFLIFRFKDGPLHLRIRFSLHVRTSFCFRWFPHDGMFLGCSKTRNRPLQAMYQTVRHIYTPWASGSEDDYLITHAVRQSVQWNYTVGTRCQRLEIVGD